MAYNSKDERSNSKSEVVKNLGVTELEENHDAQHAKLNRGQGGKQVDAGNGAGKK